MVGELKVRGSTKRTCALRGFAGVFGLGFVLVGFGGILGLGGMFGLGEVFGLGDVITPREEVRYANNSLSVLTGTLFLFLGFGRIGYELRRHVI